MRIVMFYHSLRSDWNHGNAHFLRGIVTDLIARAHDVVVYEPHDAWSVQNLVAERGVDALDGYLAAYPGLTSERYGDSIDLARVLDGADMVLVHEWNEHDLVRRIGEHRDTVGGYVLYFHDTHHRSVTDAAGVAAYDLRHYDAVLAFGAVIRDVYLERGWAQRAFTWHEAADVRAFHPVLTSGRDGDLVWIGNWGDGERAAELEEFLINPVRTLGLRARIHGVRYPADALALLAGADIDYAGWLPNYDAPAVFARFGVTVHVPRRPYVRALPGIPTIRIFEALACGIPLVSAPWDDAEHLFTPGADYLVANDGAEMRQHLYDVLNDSDLAKALTQHGLSTIFDRHTCGHRVDELFQITEQLASNTSARMLSV